MHAVLSNFFPPRFLEKFNDRVSNWIIRKSRRFTCWIKAMYSIITFEFGIDATTRKLTARLLRQIPWYNRLS